MLKSEFYYDLPEELIAQTPIEPRNASRMLVLNKNSGKYFDDHFLNLKNYLKKGDLLVMNDSRVLPARLIGFANKTGSPIELLLLEQKSTNTWEVLVKPGKRAVKGSTFTFGNVLFAKVIEVKDDGNRIVSFEYEDKSKTIFEILEIVGQTPLPPYIKEKLKDPERYQTVYSKELGSSAAPTAGLHFTKEMISNLEEQGIDIEFVTLHVGLGTFRPVKENNILDHKMHSEHIYLTQDVADKINNAKEKGNRVIAVGTTSCRTLEAVGQKGLPLKEFNGYTDIFIYPGYKFNVIDGLITNFLVDESL